MADLPSFLSLCSLSLLDRMISRQLTITERGTLSLSNYLSLCKNFASPRILRVAVQVGASFPVKIQTTISITILVSAGGFAIDLIT